MSGLRAGLVGAVVLLSTLTACTGSDSASTSTEPTTVRVMQFNLEYGGTLVDFNSVPAAIEAADADVVALQEAYGNTCKVSEALAWAYCDPRTQTISRFPLVAPTDPVSPEVLVAVEPGAVFGIVNVHLPSTPYGPNRAASGATEAELIAGEKGRLLAVEPALDATSRLQDDGIPVVLLGDFNAPSHLDWTADTEGVRDHVIPVRWPVSTAVEATGMVDVYRTAHPDPVADQGLTWPASRPKVGTYNPGPAGKPADRIDLAYASSDITVAGSQVVGEPGSDSDLTIDPWSGDHRAVVSELDIPLVDPGAYVAPAQRVVEQGQTVVVNVHADPEPTSVSVSASVPPSDITAAGGSAAVNAGVAAIDTTDLVPGPVSVYIDDAEGAAGASAKFWVTEPGAEPTVSAGKASYRQGAPIEVSWTNAPGNKWDWLGVYKRGADPNVASYLLWAYTDATVAGTTQFDDTSHGTWPLPPGKYDVVLLKDDSYAELARAPFSVTP